MLKYQEIEIVLPKLVPKRERVLKGSKDLILSLYTKGMIRNPFMGSML